VNVVDSSGWLEYFADGPNAGFFAAPIRKRADLIVPTVSIYEVFKRIVQQRDESEALRAVAIMQQGALLDLTETIALAAAKVSVVMRLPMADSIMLASARATGATLWTQDADFEGVDGVRYVAMRT
jgi:predicted nucleic acid-binding protein